MKHKEIEKLRFTVAVWSQMSAIILGHTTKLLALISAIITPKNAVLNSFPPFLSFFLYCFLLETKGLFVNAYQDPERSWRKFL